jgi:hypothetical protein
MLADGWTSGSLVFRCRLDVGAFHVHNRQEMEHVGLFCRDRLSVRTDADRWTFMSRQAIRIWFKSLSLAFFSFVEFPTREAETTCK